jgi:hypothetical protein
MACAQKVKDPIEGDGVVEAAAEEKKVVGGVEGLGAPSLAQSKPFIADLFHSNWVPEDMASIREKTSLSSF